MRSLKPGMVPCGFIDIVVVDRRGRERFIYRSRRNATTYEGMDALGLVMSGQIAAHFNGMYFGFDSTGVSGVVSTSAATTAADFHALTGNQDVARVKLGTHVTEASGASYASNRVVIAGAAEAGLTGIINSQTLTGGVAEVTHFGLIVAEDWSDYTKDKVYAVYSPAATVLVPVGGHVSMRWRPTFTPS